jgi:hypothetical protein
MADKVKGYSENALLYSKAGLYKEPLKELDKIIKIKDMQRSWCYV